jgi:peroxin-19
MASADDMDAILDQALDDLEKVGTTTSGLPVHQDATGVSGLGEKEQSTGPNVAPSGATKTQRTEAKGGTSMDPEEFFRYLIEGDDEELEEENRDAELDQFMKEMKEKFQEQTRNNSSTKKPSDETPVDEDVAATLASILEQMTTIDQDDPFLQTAAGDFKPDDIVDGMMQQLLSKDLMYEPMKQVADKFPAWLEENEGNLSETELER